MYIPYGMSSGSKMIGYRLGNQSLVSGRCRIFLLTTHPDQLLNPPSFQTSEWVLMPASLGENACLPHHSTNWKLPVSFIITHFNPGEKAGCTHQTEDLVGLQATKKALPFSETEAKSSIF
jgi:hypothetical protein